MSGILQMVMKDLRAFGTPAGQQVYTTPGTYSWIAPAGVTSVSAVAVGGGANGGGGLGYKNNISVTPGTSYTVVVGAGSIALGAASDSYFINTSTVRGGGANIATEGTYTGDGGGNGGYGASSNGNGGGGAGGYSSNGGSGGGSNSSGNAGAGGAAGGGAGGYAAYSAPTLFYYSGAGGGGTGLLGAGSNGAGGTSSSTSIVGGGGGGSSGATGSNSSGLTAGNGGLYGGGGGWLGFIWFNYPSGSPSYGTHGTGASGAVRIIWAGTSGITRQFPSTNTGDL